MRASRAMMTSRKGRVLGNGKEKEGGGATGFRGCVKC